MYKKLSDINLANARIFLRVDYNVPIQDGRIMNYDRIEKTLLTIQYLIKNGISALVICSHLGRPKGTYNDKLSLKPVFEYLKTLPEFDKKLQFKNFYDDWNDKYILLENIRFLNEEENLNNDNVKKFTEQITKYCDYTVIDAFGVVHREAASLTKTGLPCFPGLLIEHELAMFDEIKQAEIDLLILGGKKVSDKILLIKNMLPKTKRIFVGGAMAYTIMKNKNIEVGESLVENDTKEIVDEIYKIAKNTKTEIILPIDHVEKKGNDYQKTDNLKGMGVDIGPKTVTNSKKLIDESKFIFWNGPVGIFEQKESQKGTKQLVTILQDCKAKVVVGGGDSASAVGMFGDKSKFYHVSTGGGSLLTLMEGKKLPGLEVIKK